MSFTIYERTDMPVPFYVRAANTMSSTLFSKGSPLLAAAFGAVAGHRSGKSATYAVQSGLSELFWRYIFPNTIQKAFMHRASNGPAIAVGVMLSCAASIAIPYTFTKYVTPYISETTPVLGKLKQESRKIELSDVIKSSMVPMVVAYLRASVHN